MPDEVVARRYNQDQNVVAVVADATTRERGRTSSVLLKFSRNLKH